MALISGLLGARVNGLYYDFTSVEFAIEGVGVQANVTEINYSATRDPGIFRGSSAMPRGRTRGTLEFEADFSIYKEDFEAIKSYLADLKDGGGFMLAGFDITVNMREAGAVIPVTDSILGANIVGVENSFSEGNEPLLVKVSLSVMKILFNGIPPLTEKTVGGLLPSG